MPFAVTHVILTIVALDIIRDYIIKDRKTFPLHYLFIGGVAGLLPDIDIPLFWLLDALGISVSWFHRTFTHSLLFAFAFMLVTVTLFLYSKKRKHWLLAAVATFGVSFHLLLDGLLGGYIMLFYPFSTIGFGIDLAQYITMPAIWQGIDALILLVWLWDLDRRHNLRDYM
ncbi:MAG TPA: metal-dependent hydrolase [Candidatus Nanoarchaeia archaeon]|nr:metal-dependent hydrolase [Candidatus Nanoarchaeia archaeon]